MFFSQAVAAVIATLIIASCSLSDNSTPIPTSVSSARFAPTSTTTPVATPTPVPTPTPNPTATPAPTPTAVPKDTSTPTPVQQSYEEWPTAPTPEPNREVIGYGYAPYEIENQLFHTDLVAWVKPLSVEPSFKVSTGGRTDPTYYPYVNITLSVIESLWGYPVSDTIVVEYPLSRKYGEEAHAMRRAKEWIIARQNEWWQNDEAIVFLSEIRLLGWPKDEIDTGAQYIIATGEDCWKYGPCSSWWDIDYNDQYQDFMWPWLPMVERVATSEEPYSEPVFRVKVTPYGATRFEYITTVATLSNIRSIVQALTAKGTTVRGGYLTRVYWIWEQKKSDNYSFVFWGTNLTYEPTPPIKVIVRNGQAIEGFYVTAFEKDGVMYPAGSKVDKNDQTLPTLEGPLWGWYLVRHWLGSPMDDGIPIVNIKFDYEYGYPSEVVIDAGSHVVGFHASDYTPLEE